MESNYLFVAAFNAVSEAVHKNAVAKGFWDDGDRNFGEAIALMHSELSEAFEGYRKKNPPDEHCPEFSSVEIEFADAIIRLMDFCAGKKLRVAEALLAKMAFNSTRPYKHGKAC